MTAVADAVRTPYKGLSPFDDTELDALLFFGRERETEIVVANALASRLTVLYGPSGVGKSSLLRAGVVHSLRKLTEMDSIVVAYYSSWAGDPLGGIEEAVRGSLAEMFGGDPGEAAGDLADRLDAWTAALGCELCLVLDQFEELFLYHEEGGLLEALPELVTRPGLRVNVVLGIRDDELAKLDIFKARIPGLFSNYLRLDLLDRDAARAAILGPLDRYNETADEPVAIEPELVETVLGEVAAGRIDPGLIGRGSVGETAEDRTRVETPYLQLVMQKLWEVERERHSTVLRLATLAELGGAQRIVEDHLEHAMAALTPLQRDVAAGMFDHLVTPSGAKIAHGVTDLASFARVGEARIEPVLSSLARARILRPTGENGNAGDRYEIYHDVLAGAVLAWRARHEAETALERERIASRRRQRRLAIIAGISLAAFALMAALSAYALSQRSTARHQAAIAHAQEARAIVATKEALASSRAARREARKARQLARKNKLTAAEEQRQRIRADAKTSEANQTNDQLHQAIGQLNSSTAQLKHANTQLEAAKRTSDLSAQTARNATRAAQAQTRKAQAATQHVRAGLLVQRSQAELATNPVQSVRDALSATKLATTAGTEDVLRSALLATHVLATLPVAGSATKLAYSHDGAWIAVADDPGETRVYTASGAHLVARFSTATAVKAVAFSADDRLLATGARNGTIQVWDLASKSLVRTARQGGPVVSVAYSPDGKVLATAGGSSAKLWDAASGVLLRTLPHDRALRTVSFSPDSRLLLTVSNETAAHVWDVATGALVSKLPQKQEVTSAAFGPDSTLVVTGSRDGTGKIWNARTGAATATLTGHTGQVLAVAFSPAGDKVATGSVDGTAREWTAATGALVDVIRGFSSSVVSVAYSPTAESLVAASSDGSAITSGPAQRQISLLGQDGGMRQALFSPDGTVVATIAGSGAKLWEPYGEPQLHGIHKGTVAATSVAFDPTGKLLASGDANGDVLVQRAHGGPLRTLSVGSPVVALSWARNGLLMVAAQDGTLHLRANAGTTDAPAVAHGSTLVAAALRDDGAVAASAGSDGFVRTWDAKTGGQLLELHPPTGLTSVALDPRGRLVAVGVGDNVVVYDAHQGKLVATLQGHTDAVTALSFSPDGSQLASSSRDHDARVWDTKALRLVKVLHGHTASVSGVVFSGDGRWIATAGPSKAGIWAPGQTDLPAHFMFFVRGNEATIASVAFSPHGWELATAARDGSIHVFDCALCGRLPNLKSYAAARLKSLER
ncbi:MAG TPA: hypothetical protein VH210_13005 [Gaiellaceae bacterium]|jgi:WD40 repeat protein|nr:hypothetical protein [Gaiellaceae bacterium]